jgi:membrane-bound ClpP family serine protease
MRNLRSAKALPTVRRIFLVCASLVAIYFPTNAEAREMVRKGDVVVVPLRGEVSPSLLMFLRRAEKEAESTGAAAIIF